MSDTEPTFATVRRGYDPAQVQSYLGRLTEQVQIPHATRCGRWGPSSSRHGRNGMRRSRNGTSASAASYEQASARVAELMMTLDRDVERIRGEAEAETEDILAHARSEAYQIRAEAEELHKAAEQARDDADRSVEDVKARRDEVLHGSAGHLHAGSSARSRTSQRRSTTSSLSDDPDGPGRAARRHAGTTPP